MARIPVWVRAGLLGMVCVALSSGLQPWGAAIAGALLPADLAADIAAAYLFSQRISPYGPVIRDVHAGVTGLPLALTFPYFPHPPFSLIVGIPLSLLSFQAAATCWFAFTMGLVFVLAVLLDTSVPGDEKVVTIGVPKLWLLLLVWPPVLYNTEKGQWSVLVAVLLALAWRAVTRDDLARGAMWTAVAASVKVFPIVLAPYFLLRSIRATVWFVSIGVVLVAIPLTWIGFDSFPAFVHESRLNLPYWESFPLVMFSLHGVIARLFVGGQWAEPLVYAPTFAKVIEGCLIAVLLSGAMWLTVQARRGRGDHSMALLGWLVLLPILNPLSFGHNGVLLALPIVVLGRTLASRGREWHRWAWALAVTLVSVPAQTVWRFAALPVTPIEGLAIAALPTWGALLLFLVTLSIATAGVTREPIQSRIW